MKWFFAFRAAWPPKSRDDEPAADGVYWRRLSSLRVGHRPARCSSTKPRPSIAILLSTGLGRKAHSARCCHLFAFCGLNRGEVCISNNFDLRSPNVQQPNLVFILIDDLGWRDLGCYGSTFYETPHLDQLAA